MFYMEKEFTPSVLLDKEPKVWRAHKQFPRWQRNMETVSGGEFSILHSCSLRAVHIYFYIVHIYFYVMQLL